ncbi:MAG: 16S rRNA (adenine(1518)-N(6)/adenine(1519)-N(6))-dimethyltransferase RsmA [Clostridiales bacterium]|nr:16S rRNA (adenine(1518)-N(6)/adenine(1519)-N(6))-dimethyltransferase RsmA [Clostridiales bacterium]
MSEDKVKAKKSYGQNFLNNDSILEQISSLCGSGDRLIIEIGPGIGALTKKLSEKYARVRSVELDKSLADVLESELGECSNVEVLYEDFLKLDIGNLIGDWNGKISVCANIPYYITSPIVDKLMDNAQLFDNIVLLVQKEVADKLCAETGSGDAVPLTYKLKYYADIKKCLNVAPGNFTPPPKVWSTVVKIDIKERYQCSEEKLFKLIEAGFYQRRKKFVNSVRESGLFSKDSIIDALKKAGINNDVRGENLTLEQYIDVLENLT